VIAREEGQGRGGGCVEEATREWVGGAGELLIHYLRIGERNVLLTIKKSKAALVNKCQKNGDSWFKLK